ncbi:MAG: sigma-54-dependent Fis family transcriptional regulator [Candidatus Eisenbacteria sp.]|nr:sigma-54-dependent Fis family transcriptional regulator [Candidatus Eisenbacteria bacterium]
MQQRQTEPRPPARILVVDDESLMRGFLEEALRRRGHVVAAVSSAEEALIQLPEFAPDLALLDVRLGGMDGIDLLARIRERMPACGCVMMTAHGTVATAVQAMKRGALDFMLKPFTVDALQILVEKSLGVTRLQAENRELRARLSRWEGGPVIIGRSRPMMQLTDLVRTLARARATVLIVGESGTGKELIAEALHAWGPRSAAPLIKVNCAALPAGVMESELFGHERGAFTGASQRQRGKFELADGGTLLLDEIGEMEIGLQPKLLRVLQDQEFYRVGGSRPVRVDARIVATTNADLDRRVSEGRFREDLLYRLRVVPVRVPPLRERREDIPLLAQRFLSRAAAENARSLRGIAPAVLEALMRYDWPGNVRQLENVIERAVVVCQNTWIETRDLLWDADGNAAGAIRSTGGEGSFDPQASPARRAAPGAAFPSSPVASVAPAPLVASVAPVASVASVAPVAPAAPGAPAPGNGGGTLRERERRWILEVLAAEGGNRTRAARRLGVSVRTIRNKLRSYQASELERAA